MKILGQDMFLNIIVAVDKNGVFGNDRDIPWKDQPFAKDDFKHFKKVTDNSICIMGYRTYEEILKMKISRGGDPTTPLLSGRDSYVLTSKTEGLPSDDSVKFVPFIRSVIEELPNEETRSVFILGGEKVFLEALAWTNTIYLTVVKGTYPGNKYFPIKYMDKHFKIESGEETDDLTFLVLKRFN
jgi:dihydrofolate reductase